MLRRRSSVLLGGTEVDVWARDDVLEAVARRLLNDEEKPLFLASANLDHIAHFGPRGRSRKLVDFEAERAQWLVLLDGVPLVWRCRSLTAGQVEQLAGSDLLSDMLDVARRTGSRVGIFGGAAQTHLALQAVLAEQAPDLQLAGFWSPSREELTDPRRCAAFCAEMREARVDLLVVALGKPRQEQFLADYGPATGARVGLAFGAAIDFLAGEVHRAPDKVRRLGLEWLWRLAQEPRRLSRRYLIEEPPCAVALLTQSRLVSSEVVDGALLEEVLVPSPRASRERRQPQSAGVGRPVGAIATERERRQGERRTTSVYVSPWEDRRSGRDRRSGGRVSAEAPLRAEYPEV